MIREDQDGNFLCPPANNGPEVAPRFLEMYNTYGLRLIYFAQGVVSSRADAEDICADVFEKLWQRSATDWNSPYIKTYLFVATRNACINFLKSRQRRREQSVDNFEDIPSEESAQSGAHDLRFSYLESIRQVINKLPAQRKRVLELYFFEDRTTQEIADELNMKTQTVLNYKTRGLETLRLFATQIAISLLLFSLSFPWA
jgi:RNA polymerase sigma-70 factor (family 1)